MTPTTHSHSTHTSGTVPMFSPTGRPASSTGLIVKSTAARIITAALTCGSGASRCAAHSTAHTRPSAARHRVYFGLREKRRRSGREPSVAVRQASTNRTVRPDTQKWSQSPNPYAGEDSGTAALRSAAGLPILSLGPCEAACTVDSATSPTRNTTPTRFMFSKCEGAKTGPVGTQLLDSVLHTSTKQRHTHTRLRGITMTHTLTPVRPFGTRSSRLTTL